jgi:HNH endonuclease
LLGFCFVPPRLTIPAPSIRLVPLSDEIDTLVALRQQLLAALDKSLAPGDRDPSSPFEALEWTEEIDPDDPPLSWDQQQAAWRAFEQSAVERYTRYREQLDAFLRGLDAEAWRTACHPPSKVGSYSVVVRDGNDHFGPDEAAAPLVIACLGGVLPAVADELYKRIRHIGPETLVEGVTLDAASEAKELLRMFGLSPKVREGQRPRAGDRRQPIPERVRNEVWRRDQGRCVDCGSRERLEYDHIIPVSKGGSDTARNIELRCESCNRKKGART